MELTKRQVYIYLLIGAAILAFMAVFTFVENRTAPGGYPQLFYGGQHYTGYFDADRTLPEGWTQCGAVTEEIPARKAPKRDGQCNWLPEGAPIYANPADPDALYVQSPTNWYFYFEIRS